MASELHGELVKIEDGEVYRCPCGIVKDGSTRGPRGGRRWKYVLTNGMALCAHDCTYRPQAEADDAADSARAAFEEDQGEAMFGPDERDWP